MAISRNKKQSLVADLEGLLKDAKMTVFAEYQGLSVADVQELRKLAREAGVTIKIVKNRLVKVALGEIAVYKDTDTTGLTGQLLYAVSSADEVAPAQILDKFAKTHDMLAIHGAFSGEGRNLSEDEVKSLAKLPSKNQLIAEVVAQLLSPVTDSLSALNPLGRLLNALEQKATN
jgi:large subunit ribosomal protein L10